MQNLRYNFDNISDDFDLTEFDRDLKMDEELGMFAMIHDAQSRTKDASGLQLLGMQCVELKEVIDFLFSEPVVPAVLDEDRQSRDDRQRNAVLEGGSALPQSLGRIPLSMGSLKNISTTISQGHWFPLSFKGMRSKASTSPTTLFRMNLRELSMLWAHLAGWLLC